MTDIPGQFSSMYEPEAIYLSAPFAGRQRLIQGWGENPHRYAHIRIAGVSLLGHNGLDFELPANTNVLAADAGQVISLGETELGYGRYIRIQHHWGESLYAHLQEFTVESGQFINRGEAIGKAGQSVRTSKKHLHFSIRIAPYYPGDGWGGYTNPLLFLDPANLIISGHT